MLHDETGHVSGRDRPMGGTWPFLVLMVVLVALSGLLFGSLVYGAWRLLRWPFV